MDNRDVFLNMHEKPDQATADSIYSRPAEFIVQNGQLTWTFYGIRKNKEYFAALDIDIRSIKTLEDYLDLIPLLDDYHFKSRAQSPQPDQQPCEVVDLAKYHLNQLLEKLMPV